METTATKEHEYRTIDHWRHAMNVKTANRRDRKQARATRQATGQRKRHTRVGAWTRTKRRMCSRSWRH